MNVIQTAILSVLPGDRKTTPSGWTSMDSPCCHHRGHNRDQRGRSGLRMEPGGGWVWNCLNCGFKAGWQPGKLLSSNSRLLMSWLGIPEDHISRLNMFCLKNQQSSGEIIPMMDFDLPDRHMPDGAVPMTELIQSGFDAPDFLSCVQYIQDRGMQMDWYPWHWTDEPGYRDRVIIPFYHDHRVVGWTGRKVTPGKPKYLTSSHPGYVFNLSAQPRDRKYVILTEGQLDAIAIDGVAIMHNTANDTQCARINNINREVIVVPDRDAAGARMLDAAIKHGWSVSIPPWHSGIKDVADAQLQYGRLYTLHSIIHYRQSNPVKIQIMQKQLEKIHEKNSRSST